MLRNKIFILFITLACLAGGTAFSQTTTPYSRYGYGQLADNSIGMSRGMGGIGYGLRTNQQINPMNPASYTAMDSLTFLFDVGTFVQFSSFKENGNSGSTSNGGLEYVALQFPVGKHLAISAGLLPFSFVGYEFTGGGSTSTTTYSGEGGFSQAYVGLGAHIYKGLSLGVNISYLFGSLSYTDMTSFPSADNAQVTINERKMRANDVRFQFGAQYTQKVGERKNLTLGVSYTPKKSLNGEFEDVRTLYTPSSSTDYNSSTTYEKAHGFGLANSYGIGATYNREQLFTVGADVTYQDWGKQKYANETGVLNNRIRIGVGAEYIPAIFGKSYFSRIRYRVGGFYNKSYLKVKTSDLTEYGAGCGFGFPLGKNSRSLANKSMVNFSFDYVRQQPSVSTFIKENTFRMSLSLTFNEFWFFKPKLQ